LLVHNFAEKKNSEILLGFHGGERGTSFEFYGGHSEDEAWFPAFFSMYRACVNVRRAMKDASILFSTRAIQYGSYLGP
jgi:hypothetical protein